MAVIFEVHSLMEVFTKKKNNEYDIISSLKDDKRSSCKQIFKYI